MIEKLRLIARRRIFFRMQLIDGTFNPTLRKLILTGETSVSRFRMFVQNKL